MTDARPNMLRNLAERAAAHPRIEQAVAGAVLGAVRATLPGVIEALLAEQADAQWGTLRFHVRKVPQEARDRRDQRVRALLAAGVSPEQIAIDAGCSRRHVYYVRRQMHGACNVRP
jgi:hypothetical protein